MQSQKCAHGHECGSACTYTCHMDYGVNILDSICKDSNLLEVLYLYEVEIISELRPGFNHGFSFSNRPGGPADFEAP